MKTLTIAILSAALLTGCVSLPNPFTHGKPDYEKLPAESLKAIALEIETAVQEGNREPRLEDREGLVVNSETIIQAVRMRAARSDLLNQLLDAGFGQEENNGLVKVMNSKEYRKATSAKQRSRDALLVFNENNDRWAIYEDIVKQSNIRGSIATVQDAFHNARVQVMKDGQKFQTPTGETAVKGK